jgi:molybdopterin/thiamine biosynthesis adenylyltransferase
MNHVHQLEIFDPDLARRLIILGAGSVGSVLAVLAAKVGIRSIEIWDADNVESHNSPMSAFGPRHIGQPKVQATADAVRYLTDLEITCRQEMYAGQPLRDATVVACVDTMKARRLVWQAVRMNASVDLFCDSRVAGAFAEAYSVEPCHPDDIARYEKTLCDDSKVALQTCGNHGIIYAAARVASGMLGNITNYWQTGAKQWWFAERCDTLRRADFSPKSQPREIA